MQSRRRIAAENTTQSTFIQYLRYRLHRNPWKMSTCLCYLLFTVRYRYDMDIYMSIYMYMVIYTYMVLFTTVKKEFNFQVSGYLKDCVHTHRSIWSLPIASISKSATRESRVESAALRWANERSDLNQGCYSLTHFVLLNITSYGSKCTTIEQPHTMLKLSLFWFRIFLPLSLILLKTSKASLRLLGPMPQVYNYWSSAFKARRTCFLLLITTKVLPDRSPEILCVHIRQ